MFYDEESFGLECGVWMVATVTEAGDGTRELLDGTARDVRGVMTDPDMRTGQDDSLEGVIVA